MPRSLQLKHSLSRRDAVACTRKGGDVQAYKGSQEYQDRSQRRARQGNGLSPKRPHATGETFRQDHSV